MPPQGEKDQTWVLYESDMNENENTVIPPSAEKYEFKIIWKRVAGHLLFHIFGIYGGYLFITKAMWTTWLFTLILYVCSTLGVTAAVHRLWSHKSYKARLPLRILLAIFNTVAYQNSIINWAHDHRLHHKYSDTDADPHNSTRGFFFSHIGWLLVKRHPEIKAKKDTIDVTDLWADPVLRFQKKYYFYVMPIVCFLIPTYIPTLWGETLWNGFFVCGMFRYVCVLHATFLVNSAAHMWGSKPYDKNIQPVQNNTVSVVLLGEGFHNYHHTFPWDYKAAELGDYALNFSTHFINFMAKIGWAYDLKTVSNDMIEKRSKRTGDGSRKGQYKSVEKFKDKISHQE